MAYQDAKSLQLFDLLAREWELSAPIEGVVFNNSDTAVAFTCSDGTVSIVSTEDKESSNNRVHHAIDTGVQSIQPRSGSFEPARQAAFAQQRTSSLVPQGEANFLFGTENGQLITVTMQGDSHILNPEMKGSVVAVACRQDGKMLSCAAGKSIHIYKSENLSILHEIETVEPVVGLAYSPDGNTLSIAHMAGISLWNVLGEITKLKEYPLSPPIDNIFWSVDSLWIAGTSSADGFTLINTQSGWIKQFSDFPTPVDTLSFSHAANAVVTSGAFRVAAWSLKQLGQDKEDNGALHSGKAGLVPVRSVAASPVRNLVAVGYANGLLCLTQIGHQEEMLLAQDNDVGVSVLSWSKNGAFLAIGKSNGKAALIEFPRGMFK